LSESILVGRESTIYRLPVGEWRKHLEEAPERIARRLDFMTEDHHRVRYFVVRELPRIGKPIAPGLISDELKLSLEQTRTILDQLEERLFFHVRDEDGAVVWAFPVSVEETPHRLVFDTGERLYAA
jgi:hypothetical protein